MKYTEREEIYFTFLNNLRDSGVTNMFGAAPYLEAEFGLELKEAKDVLVKWMKSFDEETEETVEESAEEETEKVDEESTEDHSDEVTRFEFCTEHLAPNLYETHAYHEKDDKYYRVDRYTDKRVYFNNESKKFAPKTAIKFYLVKGLT